VGDALLIGLARDATLQKKARPYPAHAQPDGSFEQLLQLFFHGGGRAGKRRWMVVVGAASVFVDEEERRLPRLEPDDDELGGVGGQLDVDDIGRALRVVADVGRRQQCGCRPPRDRSLRSGRRFPPCFSAGRGFECPPPRQKRSTAQEAHEATQGITSWLGARAFRKAAPARSRWKPSWGAIDSRGWRRWSHRGASAAVARVALPAKGDGKIARAPRRVTRAPPLAH